MLTRLNLDRVHPSAPSCKTLVEILVDDLKRAPFYDFKDIRLQYQSFNANETVPTSSDVTSLRVLALKGDISESIQSLLPYIEKTIGTKIFLDALEYEDLYQKIQNQKDNDYYDVYIFDLPWLHDLSENNYLKDISPFITKDFFDEISFDDSIFKTFAMHNGRVFAFPFMPHCHKIYFLLI